jgi:cholesterol transport system auxiliary component
MNKVGRLIVLLAGTLALTACSMLVGKREDLVVYAPALARVADAPPRSERHWQLSVAEPRAISPLDGSHIAVMPVAGEVQTYKGVRWRDTSPVLIQQLLLEAFQNSAGLAGVGSSASALHADFALQSDLSDFQAEYRGASIPTVVIRLNTQLVDTSSGRALTSRAFVVEQPCAGAGMPEVFAAFQSALNELLPQVVESTVAAGDVNWRENPR